MKSDQGSRNSTQDLQRKRKKEQVLQILARTIRAAVESKSLDFSHLQEIKLRIGQPLVLIYRGKEYLPIQKDMSHYLVSREEVQETLEYVSNYSLYAYENEMRQGYITVEGGHRVGITGKTIMDDQKIKNLTYISSINIRVSHEVIGCAETLLPYIVKEGQICHCLIISPPRCGKTTLLRDMIRLISDGNEWIRGWSVGVVDERSEIGGCYMGIPQNQLGMRTDILDCCPKVEGMLMLIRSMAPQVIAVDEIGCAEDVHAIAYAMHCGCKMLATVHGMSMEEIRKKPVLETLIKERLFERYIVLTHRDRVGEVEGIYDERGSVLCSS